ncbi:MAG TPA: hypothetical protein VFH63_03675 [candidate division Zixibacteria bacterium]|nr:hypothetical protein [candidate division Zixibacteria bacterium]
MRLADWPRVPYLNEEVREWISLHLRALGVEDIAVFATTAGREEDERRVLVASEVGLLDTWYAPRGSSARYALNVRLYPWQQVRGVDLRGETYRVWAHEHQSRWRLRLARPALDVLSDDQQVGVALAEFAAACAVMAETGGPHPSEEVGQHAFPTRAEPRPSAGPTPRAPSAEAVPSRPPSTEPPPAEASRPAEPRPEPRFIPGTDRQRPPIRLEPSLDEEPGVELEQGVHARSQGS